VLHGRAAKKGANADYEEVWVDPSRDQRYRAVLQIYEPQTLGAKRKLFFSSPLGDFYVQFRAVCFAVELDWGLSSHMRVPVGALLGPLESVEVPTYGRTTPALLGARGQKIGRFPSLIATTWTNLRGITGCLKPRSLIGLVTDSANLGTRTRFVRADVEPRSARYSEFFIRCAAYVSSSFLQA